MPPEPSASPQTEAPAEGAVMPPEEFRRYGYQVIDWIADYMRQVRDYPVLARTRPGELLDSLPPFAPEAGEPMDLILNDFQKLILPAITHWNHPRFHAYFSVSSSGPGILAEALIAALNVNGMLWKSAPACTELEQTALGWLRQWLGLPESFFGVIHDTASSNALHAIAAARHLADPEARRRGHALPLTLYVSEHAHSSLEKGALVLGVGQDNVRKIQVDSEFRMRPDALRDAIEADLAAGKKPFFACATVGTTSVTSVDPVPAIADLAERYGLWLHVDGAYGGTAAIVPEFRCLLAGADRADSIVVNPHKWLLCPIDISVLYTRRPDVLRGAFSVVPEYLRTQEDPRALNLMDYGLPLGRRFRALKLWFVMRYFGHERAAAMIRTHVDWAREFAAWVEADSRFEVVAPAPLSLVCFRYRGSDEQNRRLMDAVNASGAAYLSHNVMAGRFVIRFAIGNLQTTRDDIAEVWRAIQQTAAGLQE
ncbi:MAG: amino acid decarboxylase [Bryobacteraceae bacterium]|nr:amino acid decarboxylase [Bryobacteraceae bacterium]